MLFIVPDIGTISINVDSTVGFEPTTWTLGVSRSGPLSYAESNPLDKVDEAAGLEPATSCLEDRISGSAELRLVGWGSRPRFWNYRFRAGGFAN